MTESESSHPVRALASLLQTIVDNCDAMRDRVSEGADPREWRRAHAIAQDLFEDCQEALDYLRPYYARVADDLATVRFRLFLAEELAEGIGEHLRYGMKGAGRCETEIRQLLRYVSDGLWNFENHLCPAGPPLLLPSQRDLIWKLQTVAIDRRKGKRGGQSALWPTMEQLILDPVISPDTFRRIREDAGILVEELGAAASSRRYSPSEVDRLIAAAREKNRRRWIRMEQAWSRWSSKKAAEKPHGGK